MSVNEDEDIRVEIQKLLAKINEDMIKLKNELSSVHSLVEENASLPVTAKMVNDKLIIAAKEAGIDLENLENTFDSEDSLEMESQEVGNKKKSNSRSKSTKSNDNVAVAVEKLSEKVKQTFQK